VRTPELGSSGATTYRRISLKRTPIPFLEI
jgi:hypothetical protein